MSSVSSQANAQSALTQTCLAAFATCRRYPDDTTTAISACSQNPTALASGLKSITVNKEQVNVAQAGIQSLAKRGLGLAVKGLVMNLRQQTPTYTCSDVVTLSANLVDLMDDNPASTLIADVAEQVTNATRVATCDASQVAALQNIDSSISATEAIFDTALEELQSTLEGGWSCARAPQIKMLR